MTLRDNAVHPNGTIRGPALFSVDNSQPHQWAKPVEALFLVDPMRTRGLEQKKFLPHFTSKHQFVRG